MSGAVVFVHPALAMRPDHPDLIALEQRLGATARIRGALVVLEPRDGAPATVLEIAPLNPDLEILRRNLGPRLDDVIDQLLEAARDLVDEPEAPR